mmetsp:Transcript_26242/g.44767  ORF Transcript_26242/g.44767 Transcript_26242/m.44767 type:complete len:83 (-) Transcript_26242:176-424(-)
MIVSRPTVIICVIEYFRTGNKTKIRVSPSMLYNPVNFLEGGGATSCAVTDRPTTVTGPGDDFFQEVSDILDKAEASLERLKK